MILAIDTSTRHCGLAVTDGSTIVFEQTWICGRDQSRWLAFTLQSMTALSPDILKAVHGVVVGCGPGSFSGTRVAVSAAKGLALALSVPLVGIPTLDVLGFQGLHLAPSATVATDAGRGRVYVAHYRGTPDRWERDVDPFIATWEAIQDTLDQGDVVVAVDLADVSADQGRRVDSALFGFPHPSFLAELGRRYLEEGGVDQLDVVEPLYLRKSAAEEKRAELPE